MNLNAVTVAHRDANDKHICVVMAIGDFQGADLCLVEPGLRVPISSGDIFVFRSAEVTHFNLAYKGVRHSIVLHTDAAYDAWHKQKNFWAEHIDTNSPQYKVLP